MDSSCPNCNRISVHSGDCKHGNWYFKSYHTCLLCGNPCPFETVSIGFGSEFDTGYLCAECTKEYIDPAIKAAQQRLHLTAAGGESAGESNNSGGK